MLMDRRWTISSLRLMAHRSAPSMSTWPEVGRSSRFIHRTRVDLPAPLIPTMPYTAPSPMVRLTSVRACRPPSALGNTLDTFFNSITGLSPLSLGWQVFIVCPKPELVKPRRKRARGTLPGPFFLSLVIRWGNSPRRYRRRPPDPAPPAGGSSTPAPCVRCPCHTRRSCPVRPPRGRPPLCRPPA